jgi:hypothetical protein
VMIGARPDGEKELLAVEDGYETGSRLQRPHGLPTSDKLPLRYTRSARSRSAEGSLIHEETDKPRSWRNEFKKCASAPRLERKCQKLVDGVPSIRFRRRVVI